MFPPNFAAYEYARKQSPKTTRFFYGRSFMLLKTPNYAKSTASNMDVNLAVAHLSRLVDCSVYGDGGFIGVPA